MSLLDPVMPSELAFRNLQRAYQSNRATMSNQRSRLSTHGVKRHQGSYLPAPFVRFKNTASETAPKGAVMRITTSTSASDKCVTIAKPDTSFHRLYLINVGGPVAENKFGRGMFLTAETFSWDTHYVLYDTANTPAYGESWGPQNDSWKLKKFRYGFTILGGNTGSGETAKTIAVQHVVNHFYGQTDAAINKGSSGTVSVYDGDNTDTSINVSSVQNKFANVAITKKVSVTWEAGAWRLTSAEC